MTRDCYVCGGAGYLATEPSPAPCPYCAGTGKAQVEEPMDWFCSACHTANGGADKHCVNCNRLRHLRPVMGQGGAR